MNTHTQNLSIVSINNGNLVTTTLAIAEGTEVQHKNVLELVKTYLSDLEEFGLVAFETRPRLEGQHGGGNTEYALLNQEQATLIMTYMRNSEIVRAFKKRLVKAFFDLAQAARQQPQHPMTFLETAKHLVAALEREEALKRELDAAQPAIHFHDEIAQSEGEFTVRDLCKVLFNGAVKERDVRDWLRKNLWVNLDKLPSAWAIKQGYMRTRLDRLPTGTAVLVSVFNSKGLTLLRHLFRKGELFQGTSGVALRLPEGKA